MKRSDRLSVKMPEFSTNESVSLEKNVKLKGKTAELNSEQLEKAFEIEECVAWIKSNGFEKVSHWFFFIFK